MKIQAIARGRAGRAAAGVEKVKREERMEVNKKRQMEKRARANRLQRYASSSLRDIVADVLSSYRSRIP